MMVPRATADTQRIRNGVGNVVQPNMRIDEPSSTSFPSPPQSDTTSTREEPTRTKKGCSWTAFLAVVSLLSAALVLRNFQAYTNISPPTSTRTVQKAALLGDGDAAAKHRRGRKERHYHDRSTRISLFGENGILTKLVAGYDDIPATTTTKATNEKTASSVWDTNGPPVPRPEGEERKSSKKHETQTPVSVNTRRGPGGDNVLGGGNTVGQSSVVARPKENPGTMQKHASEALQCRESVINFVINATDGKDECDGLIKAFDKTCSDNDQIPGPGRYRRWLQENRHRRPQRTRRLWNKLFVPHTIRLRSFLYQTLHSLERLSRLVLGEYFSPTPFFFAEDEVYKAWDDALYLVENNLDETVQKDARAFMHEQQCAFYEREDEKERIKWRRHLEHMEEEKPPSTPTNKTEAKHTAAMMNLPIKQGQHASEKMANDALLLQQGENLIKAANESFIAKEEAAKSKKSISDTSDAVSSVFNDPSSVEARTCCASILNVYHELCSSDEEEQVSDSRLFFLVLVMALCGMVKSLIRHFKILWLPEAAGCILVGGKSTDCCECVSVFSVSTYLMSYKLLLSLHFTVASGYALDLVPHSDISFDGNWFLRILVPPIIFEAALSIDKRSFNRHIVPIIIYAVAGTLLATYLTAAIVHHGTVALSGWCPAIPYVEALTFGALISSIDPIATLSVLHNMGMNDTDTIYVLIFGESLLNDGVAIVLFHTLVHFLDETLIIDREAIIAATVHFFVVAFGSLLVGVASGMLSTVYFWVFYGCQTPMVEVLMFFCWALLPYYVCDGIGWSGIVAAVAGKSRECIIILYFPLIWCFLTDSLPFFCSRICHGSSYCWANAVSWSRGGAFRNGYVRAHVGIIRLKW